MTTNTCNGPCIYKVLVNITLRKLRKNFSEKTLKKTV